MYLPSLFITPLPQKTAAHLGGGGFLWAGKKTPSQPRPAKTSVCAPPPRHSERSEESVPPSPFFDGAFAPGAGRERNGMLAALFHTHYNIDVTMPRPHHFC